MGDLIEALEEARRVFARHGVDLRGITVDDKSVQAFMAYSGQLRVRFDAGPEPGSVRINGILIEGDRHG